MVLGRKENIMKTLYLHIGAPKTGTSSLQNFFWVNQDVFKKKGYCVPYMPFQYKHKSGVRNGLFLTSVYMNENGKRDKHQEEENLKEGMMILEKTFMKYDNVILTDEGIWNGFFLRKNIEEKAEVLLESAQRCGYQIKVIVYLRRQVDYILSWYNQLIKHSSTKKMSCISWEDYYRNYEKYIALDYFKYISQLEKFFGKDNLIVRRFDRKYFVNNSLIDDFMSIIGLDKDEDFIDKKAVVIRNTGITENACSLKRIINRIKKIKPEEKRMFEKILIKHSADFKDTDKYSLMSAEEVTEFMNKYNASNQQLADNYISDGEPLFEEKKHNKEKWSLNNPDYLEDAFRFMFILHLESMRKIKELEEEISLLKEKNNKSSYPIKWVKKKYKDTFSKTEDDEQ